MSIRKIHPNIPIVKQEKKSPVDYVLPFNDCPIPLALEYARQSYLRGREYGLIMLAYDRGATQVDVAKALGVDPSLISREYPKGGSK